MTIKNRGELLERVFQKLASSDRNNSNDHMNFDSWEWPTGVAIYGLFKYYRFTGKEHYLQVMEQWFKERLDEGLPPKNVNSVAPLLTLIHLYELNRSEAYLQLCTEWAEWIIHEMPRTEEDGLQHITVIADNEEQLWDDTLFMTVLFLAKMGELTGNEAYRQEAVYQFLIHVKYLTDPSTGLWYHGFCFDGRHHFGGTLWARGNCWFTAGVVEFLEISGLEGPVKRYLVEALQAQVRALLPLQHEGGLWHTVLNDSSSYVEASATAGFAYGMIKAVRMGLLDESCLPAALRAAEGVIACVEEDGTVGKVSYGTAIGMDDEHYKQIPIVPTAYGQALTIMMLTEVIRKD
ncbi:glycoside hydrolase family 88/105 protein [Paenibacillus turpanensis]|uniref:beta-galactosidase BglB n=1 Tax=Paenibacillus turpanensis TaxID=2689078 RepID=UPI001A9F9598|nr:glycoside hydrolase family 88 protein [Paenibacillus turpanensis]